MTRQVFFTEKKEVALEKNGTILSTANVVL